MTDQNLIKTLEEQGFVLDSYAIGEHDCFCPYCSHLRKPEHQKQKTCRVWIDSDGFCTYNCEHPHVGHTSIPNSGVLFIPKNKKYNKREYHKPKPKDNVKLSDKAYEYLKLRGISKDTADKFRLWSEGDWIAFPYYKFGELVNIHYRNINKKEFKQEKDPEPVFYNFDGCIGEDTIVVCEGQIDALSFYEAGVKNVVSVPSGSSDTDNPNSSKFDFVDNSLPLINACKKIILALDNDPVGRKMSETLAERLGRGRCYLVNWEEFDNGLPIKDANDLLKIGAKDSIKALVNNAKQLPMKHIVRPDDVKEKFFYRLNNGIENYVETGFENMNQYIKFQYGDFITVTGYAGSGKSLFLWNLCYNMAKGGQKILLFNFENTPIQVLKKWSQLEIKQPVTCDPVVQQTVLNKWDFLQEHLCIYENFNPNMTIEDILTTARQVITQFGAKIIVIDPLNKIPYLKGNNISAETGDLLNKLTAFSKETQTIVFLVAHPTKPDSHTKISNLQSPSAFDIANSANFNNMSDVVISVHRKQNEEGEKSSCCKVTICKVKDADYGQEGSCYFRYNTYSGEYIPIDKNDFDNDFSISKKSFGFD